jgi:AcrR family transcriptional regulator
VQRKRAGIREEQRNLTRQRLLGAALTCFEQHGYAATTIEDVVAEAEVARGTFYLHFDNKLELVRALSDEVQPAVGALYEQLDRLLTNPDRAAIREWMVEALGWFDAHRTMVLVWQELAVSEPDLVVVSPFLTADHMPGYLSRWPRHLREVARLRVVLLVQQLRGAFLLSHVRHSLSVSDEVLVDVLTDLWFTALTNLNVELFTASPSTGRPRKSARRAPAASSRANLGT